MLRFVMVLGLLLGCAGVAHAQEAPVYQIDAAHTRITFEIDHLGFSNMPGVFNDISGVIRFDPNDILQAKVDATIRVRSINMGHKLLNEKLRGAEYFNAARYPTIRFRSTAIEKLSADRGRVIGIMTMLGVSRPMALDVTFNKKGFNSYTNADTVGFSATGKLNRSDFGMKVLLPAVGDEVTFKIAVEAHIETLDMKLKRQAESEAKLKAEAEAKMLEEQTKQSEKANEAPILDASGGMSGQIATGGLKLPPKPLMITPTQQAAPAPVPTAAPTAPAQAAPATAAQPVQLQLPKAP